MKNVAQRAEDILRKLNELASISEDPTGITRTFGTAAFQQGSLLIQQWMQSIGMQTRVDAIGNVRGRLLSATGNSKTLVIGSHIDTVINAGKFDGPMGVVMGLNLIGQLIQSAKPVPFTIELIAFSDEEGVRFHTAYLGSKVVAGTFDEHLLARTDADGIALSTVVASLGGNLAQLPKDAIAEDDWLGYFEIHIEQGPVLYERNVPVAVVTDIAGQKRVAVRFSGLAGHAGTVPMGMRQDALCAAAEFILHVERLAAVQPNLVATVGKLIIPHAASNVIPGEVNCTVDMRSNDETSLTMAYQTLRKICHELGRVRSISVEWTLIQEMAPVACDLTLSRLLTQSIDEHKYEAVPLISGAGHDGVAISQVAPIAMLFVRCFKGISHNAQEHVDVPDIAAALQVGDTFLKKLIDQYQ